MKLSVLIAEGDALLRQAIHEALRAAGHRVLAVADGQAAVTCCADQVFDVVISDVRTAKLSGLRVFEHVWQRAPSTGVILMTAHASVNEAVEALKAGVDEYVTKPFEIAELILQVERLGERVRQNRELSEARALLARSGAGAKLIGRSPAMLSLMKRIEMAAPTDAGIVILGESGTGKELVARAIHEASARASGPFIAVNCAALPDTLIEAELFGHERGAFAGATSRRDGRFKAADGGTLLLDEVAEVPLKAQAKLLRVLQEGVIEPLGSDRPLAFDVRLICSTQRNLKQLIAAGAFREDLYYRLNVFEIHVPPLRERRPDLPLLVHHFQQRFAARRPDLEMTPRAWARLLHHSFPGNVRELEHAIHHAVVLSQGKPIDVEHLPPDIRGRERASDGRPERFTPLAESMREFERQCLILALNAANGTKFKAAHLLGISRKTLWEKLKLHQITDSDLDDEDELGAGRERDGSAASARSTGFDSAV